MGVVVEGVRPSTGTSVVSIGSVTACFSPSVSRVRALFQQTTPPQMKLDRQWCLKETVPTPSRVFPQAELMELIQTLTCSLTRRVR